MTRNLRYLAPALVLLALSARANVTPDITFDFETETNEGWGGGAMPAAVATGGPAGADDAFLQVGNGTNWAVFNTDLSGDLDPTITAIEVDLLRPSGGDPVDMRIVLFGPGTFNRWTSAAPTVIPSDGEWATYTFSVLEDDLTRAVGSGTYDDLVDDVNRIMFRHDPGEASPGGSPLAGTVGLDNIRFLTGGDDLIPGDINGDGSVDLLDLDVLGANFGLTPATREQGDLNDDNVVDLLDLDILGAEFGNTATSTPEPAAATLLVLAGLFTSRRRG